MELLESILLEFHGTALVIEIGVFQVPWNSMEFHGTSRVTKLAHSKFHGIPCNCSSHRNWRTPVPWNSMEFHLVRNWMHSKFHGIPWNSMELVRLSSMEFHGTPWKLFPWNYGIQMEPLVSSMHWVLKWYRIPWNRSCQRNWRILSSMEFYGISRASEIGALQVPWNSTEFHGTAHVSEIGAPQVPWNSMEFHGTSRVSEIGALQVPWNSMEFHGTARVIEIGAPKVPWNSMELLLSSKLAHY